MEDDVSCCNMKAVMTKMLCDGDNVSLCIMLQHDCCVMDIMLDDGDNISCCIMLHHNCCVMDILLGDGGDV